MDTVKQSADLSLAHRFMVAIALAAGAFVVRMVMLPADAAIPYITFFPGVAIAALLCGAAPTLLYVLLSAALGAYFIRTMPAMALLVALGAYCSAATTIFLVIHLYQRAVAARTASLGAALAERQAVAGQLQQTLAQVSAVEHEFRLAFSLAATGIGQITPDGHWLRVNPALASMLGVDPGALPGRPVAEVAARGDAEGEAEGEVLGEAAILHELLQACQGAADGAHHAQMRWQRPDGSCLTVRLAATFARQAGQVPAHCILVADDISERLLIEQELAEHRDHLAGLVAERTADLEQARQRFQTLVERAPIAIGVIEGERISICNDAFVGLFGYRSEDVASIDQWWLCAYPDPDYRAQAQQQWRAAVRAAAAQQRALTPAEYRVTCKDGSVRVIEISGVGLDGLFIATFFDVTARKAAEEQVKTLAFYDALTGLPNRRLLGERMARAQVANKRSGSFGALMFIDLDNFKPLNDRHGHEVGDLLLIEVARRLGRCVRETDTVARFGGDEFVVLAADLDGEHDACLAHARALAEKLRAALAAPYLLDVQHGKAAPVHIAHACTASIGAALFGEHDSDLDAILTWADSAMYAAKAGGRNAVCFHGEAGAPVPV